MNGAHTITPRSKEYDAHARSIRDKVNEMEDKVVDGIRLKVDMLLRSGALNLEDWEDNYLLPKALLAEALRCAADAYDLTDHKNLHTPEQKAQIENLRYF